MSPSRALTTATTRDAVDWSRVDFWWGDERFLPSGDPERNETQARAALLDALPVDPARVHPMPASDGPDGNDWTASRTFSQRFEPGNASVSWLACTNPGEVVDEDCVTSSRANSEIRAK